MMSGVLTLQRRRLLDWVTGVLLALAALVLYTVTLAPTVLEADGGEFQFVPWLPGIAHPTGYPLYVLLGWAWTHLLSIGEVAWRMNLLSAVFAAAAVGLTYGVSRLVLEEALPGTPVLARMIAAAVAAMTFAAGATFWEQAVIAEVYTLHAVFVAAILGLTVQCGRSHANLDSGWCKLLSFTIGLSLTHHRATVLLFPAIVVFLGYRWTRQAGRLRIGFRTIAIHGLLLGAPLLLYLYLPLIAPHTPYTTLSLSSSQLLVLYENTFSGFLYHVFGLVFADELRPEAAGLERLILTWELLRQQVGLVGVVLAVVGLFTLWRRRDLLFLTGLAFLGIVLFNLIYFIGDVFVLFIPAWFLVSIWIGVGGLGLVHSLTSAFVRRRGSPDDTVVFKEMGSPLSRSIYGLATTILVCIFFLLPLILFTTRMPIVDQSQNITARTRWQDILNQPLPTASVLLSNDRNEIMPMWYYQYVEGRRPDLLGLFPLIVPEPAYANIGRLLDQALASGRPVYLIKPMPGLEVKADLTPVGDNLFQASQFGSLSPTYPLDITLSGSSFILPNMPKTETVKLIGYDLSPPGIAAGDSLAVNLYWQPGTPLSRNYTSYVHLIGEDGQGITQSDHQPGGVFYPSSMWQPEEMLRDRHILTVPTDLPAGVYRLRAGMYDQPAPGTVISLGDSIDLGTLTVTSPLATSTRPAIQPPLLFVQGWQGYGTIVHLCHEKKS